MRTNNLFKRLIAIAGGLLLSVAMLSAQQKITVTHCLMGPFGRWTWSWCLTFTWSRSGSQSHLKCPA